MNETQRCRDRSAALLRKIADEIEFAPVNVVGLSISVNNRGGNASVTGVNLSVGSDGSGSACGMSISVSSEDVAKVASVRKEQANALRLAAEQVTAGGGGSIATMVLTSVVQTVTELGLTDLYYKAKEMLNGIS
ncbi:hypothetical protein [Cereibacter johrii]|uniref:hypothetical protein n=1 Tax=Cereibacter johrii TaxID=445629 RepID=UPI0011BF1344|nr:hypothetical protein [Cereibacter johrii]